MVGNRWKKIDENYDLCDAEHRKLSPEVGARPSLPSEKNHSEPLLSRGATNRFAADCVVCLCWQEQTLYVCLVGGKPSIKITSPVPGTKWPKGSIQQIEWESTGTISAVKIQYAEKSWSSWLYDWSELAISGRTDGKIPNTGKCRWRVPSEGVKAGTKMYFRVTAEQQEDPGARSFHVDSGIFEVAEAATPPAEGTPAPEKEASV